MKIHKKLLIGFGVFVVLAIFGLISKPNSVLAGATIGKGIPASEIRDATNYTLVSQDVIEAKYPSGTVLFTKKDTDLYKPPSGVFCTPDQYTTGLTIKNPDLLLADGTHFKLNNNYLGSETVNVIRTGYKAPGADVVGFIVAIADGATPTTCTDVVGVDLKLSYSAGTAPTSNGNAFTDKTVGNIKASDFTIKDGANIILNFNGASVTFHDKNPEDETRNFKSSNNDFCGGNIGEINFKDGDQAKDPLPITVSIPYYDTSSAGKGACKSGKDAWSLSPSIDNSKQLAMTVVKYSGPDIVSVSDTSSLKKLSVQTGDKSGKIFVSDNNSPSPCSGSYVVLLAESHGNSGTIFKDLTAGTGDPKTAIGQAFPNCQARYQRTINVAGTYTTSAAGGGGGGGPTGTNEACYQSGWQLSWIACPVITAAQTTANAMYGFVEDQLKFTVSDKGSDSLGKEHDSVHNIWSNFRILVSGLVVILLLVMVISQAIGTGPFDAYTVKKMLPRLVIGVILIQISWPIFSWVVNTVDDLGRGLADIMYAPFGGSEALNLNSVMKPFILQGEVFSWVGIPALAVFAVVAPFIVIGLILTVLVAIFVGFLTLLFRKIIIILALIFVPVALISWMMPNDGLRKYWKLWWDNFSKALMMFPLIVAMIAAGRIFAKIGSGQGGDFVGFFIVLVGFFGPLFILPKTFKWGGTLMQSAGSAISSAGQKGLKKPKEFLGERQKGYTDDRRRQSAERISKREGFSKNPRSWYRTPLDRIKAGQWDPTQGFGPLTIGGRKILKGSRRRQRAIDSYVSKGVASEAEDRKAALDRAQRLEEQIDERATFDAVTGKALNKDDFYQDIALGRSRVYKTYDGKEINTADIRKQLGSDRAAMDRMAVLGGATNFRAIQQLQQQAKDDTTAEGARRRGDMRKFLNDNVQTLLPKLTSLYKGVPSAADASPENIAEMHGVEIEAILSSLSKTINDPTRSVTERRAAQKSLGSFLKNYDSAARNRNLSGRMELGGTRAIKAFLSDNRAVGDYHLRRINLDPRDGRTRRGIPSLINSSSSPDVAAAIDPAVKTDLDTRIGDEGGFN